MKFKALFRKVQDVAPMRKKVVPAILALTVSLAAAVPPSAQASILVSEPFDYTPGTYPGGNWAGLSGSGVGWGSNVYFDHATNASNFVIGAGGPSGAYFESQGQNLFGSYYRNRVMSPAIHTNSAGSVLWQSMLFWSDGSNNGGGMIVHNASGGTNYNIRLANGNVYELRGGHNNTNGTTDSDISTITASTNSSAPDFLLFKVVNSNSPGVQTVSLWINPDVTLGEAGLPAPDLSVSYRPFYDGRQIGGINLSPGAVKFDEILFGTTYKDMVTAIPPVPPYAPVPADAATDISVTRTLRWSNVDADSYKVFFWESSQSKPVTPTATPTEPHYDPPPNLALNTAYSWQVIVVKGGVEAAGPTWTFQTGDPLPPGPASTPVPAHAADEVASTPVLQWTEAARATSYDVFLWPASASKPATATASVFGETYTPAAPLAYGTTYHWQIEAVNEFGRDTTSPVWEFTTERLVNTPAPSNNATTMLAWQPLGWATAPGVASYDVFLWKDGTTKPVTPTGSATTNSYFPYTYLDFGTTYHWQVVAQLTAGGTSEGPEWTFTTQTAGQTVATPPFDISPSAQAARTAVYDTHGREQFTSSNTGLTSGMKISFYGDSITWQDAYMNRIRTALSNSSHTSGLGVTLINHGVNGGGVLTIRDGDPGQTSHFGGTEPQPFATTIAADQPDVVVIFIGINDIWWRGTSAQDYEQALRDIVAQATNGGVSKVVIATPFLRNEKPDDTNVNDAQIIAFSALAQQVATDTGSTFVDLHAIAMTYLKNNNFTLEADGTLSYLETGRLTYDGVHPSNAGNDLLADQLSLAIHRALTGEGGVSIQVREDNTNLVDASPTPRDFGPAPIGTPLTRTFTIRNGGTTDLTLGAITRDGTDAASFSTTAPAQTLLAAGESTTFIVTFTPATVGEKTAALHIASDAPGDLNPFDIALSGTGLSPTADTDGDGLGDVAEFHLAALGFDWQVSQVSRVNELYGGAHRAGLHLASEVHTLRVATPQIRKGEAPGQFILTAGLQQSNGTAPYSPLPLTEPQSTLNGDGEIEFQFPSTAGASFYRVEAR